MLTVTPPISVSADEVWIFIAADETGATEAARMAHFPGTTKFIALPAEVFNTAGLFPAFADTGEYVTGFRWATTADVDEHADQFVEH